MLHIKFCSTIIIGMLVIFGCSHKELYQTEKTTTPVMISANESACQNKGYHWIWKGDEKCIRKNFSDYCKDRIRPNNITKIISIIQNEFGNHDCQESYDSLKKATGLYLSHYEIQDISPLINLVHLKILVLNNNMISNLEPLKTLKRLRVLRLDGNNINDISALRNLHNLVVLRLDGNRIKDLSPLANLHQLAQLNLNRNLITDTSALATLKSLKKLGLKSNYIDNLTPLANLHLEYLDVHENPITQKKFQKTEANCPQILSINSSLKNICEAK